MQFSYEKTKSYISTLPNSTRLCNWTAFVFDVGIFMETKKNELIECACGCGKIINRFSEYRKSKERKYHHGHNRKTTQDELNKNTRICCVCKTEKPLTDFYKHKGSILGIRYSCKECDKTKEIKNNEIIKCACGCGQTLKRYSSWGFERKYINNHYKQEKKIPSKDQTKVCSFCKCEKPLIEFGKNKSCLYGVKSSCKSCDKIKRAIYEEKNKDKIVERRKINSEKNKDKRLTYCRNWYNINKKNISKKTKFLRENDELYSLRTSLRNRIFKVFKRNKWKKAGKTLELLGCDYKTAKRWIERKFTKGMTWKNQGKWHIDHKIPLASAKTKEELIKLCHYTNLQPLWATDNIKKGVKIIEQQLTLTI